MGRDGLDACCAAAPVMLLFCNCLRVTSRALAKALALLEQRTSTPRSRASVRQKAPFFNSDNRLNLGSGAPLLNADNRLALRFRAQCARALEPTSASFAVSAKSRALALSAAVPAGSNVSKR
jgi:hypothetical protein